MASDSSAQPIERPVFRRRHRLSSSAEFGAVFDAKVRKSRGVITVFVLATSRDEHRLGLSVGRKVGNAVVRGRFKRMIREVFRHHRTDLPTPGDGQHYDIVVTTRRHEALGIEEYAKLFVEAIEAAHRVHLKQADRG